VDGAVVVSHHRDDAIVDVIRGARLPAVFVGRPLCPDGLQYVDVDNRSAGRRATEHLLAAGCRRPATIAGPQDMAAGTDRLEGWRHAVRSAGLPDDAVAVGDFTVTGGAEAMQRLLESHPDVDAVFAASDLMAEGALRTLERHGRRVPQDVRVVGFDDLGTAAGTDPALTTMTNPVVEMSQAAGELLLAQITGAGRPGEPRVFEAGLVVRDSA
jgi:DNA-binding LacI/PurR family transcriptional regulator